MFIFKPAAIIVIIWASITLFSNLTVWFDPIECIIKLIAVFSLVYIAKLEFEGDKQCLTKNP